MIWRGSTLYGSHNHSHSTRLAQSTEGTRGVDGPVSSRTCLRSNTRRKNAAKLYLEGINMRLLARFVAIRRLGPNSRKSSKFGSVCHQQTDGVGGAAMIFASSRGRSLGVANLEPVRGHEQGRIDMC